MAGKSQGLRSHWLSSSSAVFSHHSGRQNDEKKRAYDEKRQCGAGATHAGLLRQSANHPGAACSHHDSPFQRAMRSAFGAARRPKAGHR
jgi:hypothetical protein